MGRTPKFQNSRSQVGRNPNPQRSGAKVRDSIGLVRIEMVR
jgi:hypothetical protein